MFGHRPVARYYALCYARSGGKWVIPSWQERAGFADLKAQGLERFMNLQKWALRLHERTDTPELSHWKCSLIPARLNKWQTHW